MVWPMSIEYIEDGHLSKSEKKLREGKVARLNKQFDGNSQDIALAQSVANRESADALENYRKIREQRKILEHRKERDSVLFFIDKRIS